MNKEYKIRDVEVLLANSQRFHRIAVAAYTISQAIREAKLASPAAETEEDDIWILHEKGLSHLLEDLLDVERARKESGKDL